MARETGFGRTVRAAFGNAVVWGIGWTGLGLVSMFVMRAIGIYVPPEIRAIDILGMALRIGVFGAITGTAFSLLIRTVYRGKRLEELNAVRFGLVGGVAAAIFGPLFMQSMSLLSGGGLVPWSEINSDVVMLGVFGGLAAGASLKMAQVASRFVRDEPAALDHSGMHAEIGSGSALETEGTARPYGDTIRLETDRESHRR